MRAISTDIICQTIVQHCRTADLKLTATCCVKLRLSLSFSTFKSRLKTSYVLYCFNSANYSTFLFCQRLRSRLTASGRFINFILLVLSLCYALRHSAIEQLSNCPIQSFQSIQAQSNAHCECYFQVWQHHICIYMRKVVRNENNSCNYLKWTH